MADRQHVGSVHLSLPVDYAHPCLHFPTVAMRTGIKYNCSLITLSRRQEQTEFISYFLPKSRRWLKLLRINAMPLNQHTCSGAFFIPFSVLKGNFSSRHNFQRHTAKCSKTEKYRVIHILSKLISPCLCHIHIHPCSSYHLLGHPLQQSQKLQMDGSATMCWCFSGWSTNTALHSQDK